jgi:hypothetical protein
MAYQLEVIKLRDLITVTQITRFVPGTTDLTIEVTGEDFSSVEEVLVNDVNAPEFMILNKTTMWVVLPDAAKNRISHIEVLSSGFTKTIQGSKLQYKIGNKTRTVTGILKLTQLFTKWLLQSPGSDVFDPSRGGGLRTMIGQLTTRTMEPAMVGITRAVSTTTTQIREAQATQTALPMNERLLSAETKSVKIYEQQMEARAVIDIKNMAGEDAMSSLLL